GGAPHLGDPPGVPQTLRDPTAPPDHVVVERVQRALAPAHRLRVEDAADAREIARERYPPEPAVLEDVEADQSFVASLPARGALEVREEGNLAQARYGLAAAHVTRGEEAVAAARVDHEAGADGPRLAALSDGEGGAVLVKLDP